MSHHSATVLWDRGDDVFAGGRYSRAHLWQFEGGVSVTASAAPDVAPDSAALSDLHHRAHKLCFIANSVKSEIITHLD